MVSSCSGKDSCFLTNNGFQTGAIHYIKLVTLLTKTITLSKMSGCVATLLSQTAISRFNHDQPNDADKKVTHRCSQLSRKYFVSVHPCPTMEHHVKDDPPTYASATGGKLLKCLFRNTMASSVRDFGVGACAGQFACGCVRRINRDANDEQINIRNSPVPFEVTRQSYHGSGNVAIEGRLIGECAAKMRSETAAVQAHRMQSM